MDGAELCLGQVFMVMMILFVVRERHEVEQAHKKRKAEKSFHDDPGGATKF
jgi:hypothetical protein